ncbi:hypothetical protein VTJ04DRAFT_8541 [Mycothermus thermophilus]|uniref:uncharacterized protein n=1 Tax=Humicola insolens TaxID=85995 RepID=UPI00374207F4
MRAEEVFCLGIVPSKRRYRATKEAEDVKPWGKEGTEVSITYKYRAAAKPYSIPSIHTILQYPWIPGQDTPAPKKSR